MRGGVYLLLCMQRLVNAAHEAHLLLRCFQYVFEISCPQVAAGRSGTRAATPGRRPPCSCTACPASRIPFCRYAAPALMVALDINFACKHVVMTQMHDCRKCCCRQVLRELDERKWHAYAPDWIGFGFSKNLIAMWLICSGSSIAKVTVVSSLCQNSFIHVAADTGEHTQPKFGFNYSEEEFHTVRVSRTSQAWVVAGNAWAAGCCHMSPAAELCCA